MKKTLTLTLAQLLSLLAAPLLLTSASGALVYRYSMDEGNIDPSTNTIFSSTTTNTGAIAGATWITSGLPSIPSPDSSTAALQFDGTGGVTTTSGGILGNAARSVTAWVKLGTQNNASPTIVGWGPNVAPNGRRFDLRITGGVGAWKLRIEVTGSGVDGTTVIDDGNWHFVAVTHTGTSASLYVDGVLDVTAANNLTNTVATGSTTNILIGNSQAGTGRKFVGGIDDVRVYNHVLTSGEISTLYLGAGVAPSINTLADQKFVLGSTNSAVTFNPGILGTSPLQVQWKHNGVNMPGQTNDLLTISPAGVADLGTYTVAVTNAFGNTNASATLSLNTAPIAPPRQAVLLGHAASFSVTQPTDSSGYTYQWRTNGVNISGATGSTLTLPAVSAGDAGTNYQVVVTLGGNSATSTPPAKLNVLAVPASDYAKFVQADVPAGYWRLGEANGATVAVDQSGYYPGAYVGYTGIELGQTGPLVGDSDTASRFSGANYMQVPFDAELVRSNGLTLETWVNIDAIGSAQSLIYCSGGLPFDGYDLFISSAGAPVFRTYSSTSPSLVVSNDLTGAVLSAGTWYHIAATYDGAVKRLYINGTLAGTQTATYIPANGINVRCGSRIGSAPLVGYLDEIAIYSKALTAGQVADHYLIGAVGAGVPVTISAQPASHQVILGNTNTTVNFSVAASGTPYLSYQWKKGVVTIPNGTNSTLTLSPVSSNDIGTYSVVVSNSVSSTNSDSVTLSYIAGPVSPNAQAVLSGASAVFSLTGMPAYQAYTYQWKHAGTNIPNATNVSITLGSVTAADAGSYSVVATLGLDSAESAPATLSVLASPTQAYSQIVSNDAPVAWWRLNDAPGTFTTYDLVGFRAASSAYGDLYGDIVWNKEGALLGEGDTAASFTGYSAGGRASHAMLDVAYDPTLNPTVFSVECWAMLNGITSDYRSPLTSRDAISGSKGYLFYVNPSGAFQFWLGAGTNWTTLTGPVANLNEWAHLVGTYDGTTARFYVNGALVASSASTFEPNATYGLRMGAGGGTTANFFWPGRVDEVAVYGAALSLAQVQSHYAAAFPSTATPRFTVQPRTHGALAGQVASLTAKVHSTPPVSYQWKHAGTNVPGATSATIALASAAAADAGSYQVVATHGAASASSSLASLAVLPGESVSVSLMGFENVRTIAANGGVAGYVAVNNWNEVGYNANSGTASGLINNMGLSSPIGVTWSAGNNRRWNGPFGGSAAGDYALLNGLIDGSTTTNVVVTVSNIPASYQSAGYSVYAYLGAPHATSGLVDSSTWFGAVSVGVNTNFYHAMDLAVWDGSWAQATETNPNAFPQPDGNYAVFTGLTSDTLQIVVDQHPTYPGVGTPGLSGFQIVANPATMATNPTNVTWSVSGGQINLSWPADHLGWTLQVQTNGLSVGLGTNWVDVPGTAGVASTNIAIDPSNPAVFYRLRQ